MPPYLRSAGAVNPPAASPRKRKGRNRNRRGVQASQTLIDLTISTPSTPQAPATATDLHTNHDPSSPTKSSAPGPAIASAGTASPFDFETPMLMVDFPIGSAPSTPKAPSPGTTPDPDGNYDSPPSPMALTSTIATANTDPEALADLDIRNQPDPQGATSTTADTPLRALDVKPIYQFLEKIEAGKNYLSTLCLLGYPFLSVAESARKRKESLENAKIRTGVAYKQWEVSVDHELLEIKYGIWKSPKLFMRAGNFTSAWQTDRLPEFRVGQDVEEWINDVELVIQTYPLEETRACRHAWQYCFDDGGPVQKWKDLLSTASVNKLMVVEAMTEIVGCWDVFKFVMRRRWGRVHAQ